MTLVVQPAGGGAADGGGAAESLSVVWQAMHGCMTLVVQPARRFRRLILTKAATPNHLQQRFPSPEILEAHRKEDNQCAEFRIRLIDFPFSFAQISCEAILVHLSRRENPDE
ncbi:hypothetical protein [Burkholderia ubonensis]|uniref:hypothetical protein n=1 Tax=Burkholderia ubonensis TaxID=101571 RepID=UPI000AB6D5FE|nr:hypothetical protein [Burkholderia ubonensis]